jgi:hypothetical protein
MSAVAEVGGFFCADVVGAVLVVAEVVLVVLVVAVCADAGPACAHAATARAIGNASFTVLYIVFIGVS